jgi:hypothetical protein
MGLFVWPCHPNVLLLPDCFSSIPPAAPRLLKGAWRWLPTAKAFFSQQLWNRILFIGAYGMFFALSAVFR